MSILDKQLEKRLAAIEHRLEVSERLVKKLLSLHDMTDADLVDLELQAEYDLAMEATDRGDFGPLKEYQKKENARMRARVA